MGGGGQNTGKLTVEYINLSGGEIATKRPCRLTTNTNAVREKKSALLRTLAGRAGRVGTAGRAGLPEGGQFIQLSNL